MIESAPTLFSACYLAPIAYYKALLQAETPKVEQFEHYQKQTYRNRCYIAGANGVQTLQIPIARTGAKMLMRDVRISYHDSWQHQHWMSLVSAYKTTPYFDYYQDNFKPFFNHRWEFLLDFDMALQAEVLRLLDLAKTVSLTSDYCVEWPIENDFREAFHPKRNKAVQMRPYYQVFDQKYGFQPNLSIVDLLFNMGNESLLWLI